MKKIILFLLIFTWVNNLKVNAQGSILSLMPSSGYKGQQLELVIRAQGIQFSTGQTSVSLGSGITVNYINISNSLTLRVGVSIAPNATEGPRDLIILSAGQSLQMTSAFEVVSVGNNLRAILEIVPAQTIYASDFDPNNPSLAPLLFRITVMNDQVQRNLKAVFSLLLEGKGILGKATKKLGETTPGKVSVFDNREFDDYEFSPESKQIADQVTATGVLPPGNYTYRIDIYDQSNNLLASAEAGNTLINQSGDLVIVSPGSTLDFPPELIPASLPLFQWISTANQFDLAVYKVEPGQTNAQQILQTLPVFKQLGLSGNSFLYPLSAEVLESGKTYAWQLRAYINTASGNLSIEGPVHWFSYGKSNPHNIEIASFKVEPEQIEVIGGQSFQFKVVARDPQGTIIPVAPTWKVTPSTEGTISSGGLFKAGNHPKTIAVLAEYGGLKDYAVVNIVFKPQTNPEFDLLYQIFGKPENTKKGKAQ